MLLSHIGSLNAAVEFLKEKVKESDGDYFDMLSYSNYVKQETDRQFAEVHGQLQALKLQMADQPVVGMPDSPELIRAEIKQMVNTAAYDNDQSHRQAWVRLYQEFGRLYGIEVEVRVVSMPSLDRGAETP